MNVLTEEIKVSPFGRVSMSSEPLSTKQKFNSISENIKAWLYMKHYIKDV